MEKKREVWVDNVKLFACILVVLGHFFQSMVKSNILSESNLYLWFTQTIYYFHVPLFFICSGYLYQKYNKIKSLYSWKINIINKAIVLGVPYFTFSTITWILKTIFSGSVNSNVDGFLYVILVHPTAPYWFLYCLFFVYFITPVFNNKKIAIYGTVIAILMKIISIFGWGDIYIISKIFENEIWFIIGMIICYKNMENNNMENNNINRCYHGIGLGSIFIFASVITYSYKISFFGKSFLFGTIACIAVILVIVYLSKENNQNSIIQFFVKFTLPIFLMHTIFAALLRSILIKFGIMSPLLHIPLGILVSFMGPIVTAIFMRRYKWINFLVYPGEYFKLRSNTKKNNYI